MTDRSADFLSESLRYNFNIVRLDISRIELSDVGIIILAQGLQYNFHLQILNISNNYMKDQGAYAIAELLKHNNQLKELDMSCKTKHFFLSFFFKTICIQILV